MPSHVVAEYEAETVVGLEQLAAEELRGHPFDIQDLKIHRGGVRFRYATDPRRLTQLGLSQAAYRVLHFEISRPKALLGHAHFRRIVEATMGVLDASPEETFTTLGIDAAGSDTSVMQRLKTELAAAAHLQPSINQRGDLLIRVIPALDKNGWECLVRLSARPLATRVWRVHNFAAALNATVAQAMVRLVTRQPGGVFVNLCCGSGSLLIERANYNPPAQVLVGIDNDETTIHLARVNLGDVRDKATLFIADVRCSPIPAHTATALVADLPFGHQSGSHSDNLRLYPAMLEDVARIAAKGALFAALTHEIRLMDDIVYRSEAWELVQSLPITLRGLHPRIYLLSRKP